MFRAHMPSYAGEAAHRGPAPDSYVSVAPRQEAVGMWARIQQVALLTETEVTLVLAVTVWQQHNSLSRMSADEMLGH